MEIKNRDVWVFIEQRNGKPADVSFELLSKGRKLADSLKSSLKAIVIGHNINQLPKKHLSLVLKKLSLLTTSS